MAKYDNENMITFIPPDGIFELMNYVIDKRLNPLFTIEKKVKKYNLTKEKIKIKITANIPKD